MSANLDDVRLFVTMPLLYRHERLHHWMAQIRELAEMDVGAVHLHVVTNAIDPADHAIIRRILSPFMVEGRTYDIEHFWDDDDPKAMTWAHKKLIVPNLIYGSYTHFLYLEDDLRFSRANLVYWLGQINQLNKHGLLPGFIRYEWSSERYDYFLSDNVFKTKFMNNMIDIEGQSYFTPDAPYCACYLVDRALGEEYVASASFGQFTSEPVISWPSTERSAMGLMFEKVPAGRRCRMVVPFDPGRGLPDPGSLIHHLPNTFCNGERPVVQFAYGSLKLKDAFSDHGSSS